VTKTTNIEQLAKEIIDKNRQYLNPKVVSTNQIRRLLDRLVKNLSLNDKENKSNTNL